MKSNTLRYEAVYWVIWNDNKFWKHDYNKSDPSEADGELKYENIWNSMVIKWNLRIRNLQIFNDIWHAWRL